MSITVGKAHLRAQRDDRGPREGEVDPPEPKDQEQARHDQHDWLPSPTHTFVGSVDRGHGADDSLTKGDDGQEAEPLSDVMRMPRRPVAATFTDDGSSDFQRNQERQATVALAGAAA